MHVDRFIPPQLAQEMDFTLPDYGFNADQVGLLVSNLSHLINDTDLTRGALL